MLPPLQTSLIFGRLLLGGIEAGFCEYILVSILLHLFRNIFEDNSAYCSTSFLAARRDAAPRGPVDLVLAVHVAGPDAGGLSRAEQLA